MVIFLIVIVVIIILLVKRKKNKSAGETTGSSSHTSKLMLGDEYISAEPISKADSGNHMISVLYLYKESKAVWVCRNCEAENSGASDKCCVCNQKKLQEKS